MKQLLIGLGILAAVAAAFVAGQVMQAHNDPATLARAREEAEKAPALLVSAEDKALLDKMKAREEAKQAMKQTPNRFIKAGDWDRYDKGIFNRYTRATAIEFTNNSNFDVANISGSITYIGQSGQEMATVPFHAQGDLPAHESEKLQVSAGEISGSASHARVEVQWVRIIGGE